MQAALYMAREHVTDVLGVLLSRGFAVGPHWAAPQENVGEVVCYTAVLEDELRFWERLREVVESLGMSVDYHGVVYPATSFGAIVQVMRLGERDATLLSELLKAPDSVADIAEYDLLARYRREMYKRQAFHATLTFAARQMEAARAGMVRQVRVVR